MLKKANMKIEDIYITRINIEIVNISEKEWIKYGISYTYKGEKHSYNCMSVNMDNSIKDIDWMKKYISENVIEVNGKYLTGLAVIDEKIMKGEI